MSTKASAQIVIGSYFVLRVLVQLQVFMQAQRRKKISVKRDPPIDMVGRSGRSAYNAILENTIMDLPRLHVLDYYAFVLHALEFHSNQARRTHDCHHMPVVTDFVCLIPRLVYMRAAASSNLYIASLSRLSGAIPNLQRNSSTVQPEKGNNPDTGVRQDDVPDRTVQQHRFHGITHEKYNPLHSIRTPAKLTHHGASAISSHRTTPTAKTLVHLALVIPRAQSTAEIRLPVSQEGVTTGGRDGNIQTQRSGPITSSFHRGSTAGCPNQIATEKKQLSADPVDLTTEESERGDQRARRGHRHTCS
ncbi:hypothetical protein HFD88_001759 [Aspergillus terreus]|nr:hypothetical protein HFD88_001759 [Aspergillus terreus]